MITKIKSTLKSLTKKLGFVYGIGYVISFLIIFVPKDSKFDWKGKLIIAFVLSFIWPYFIYIGIKKLRSTKGLGL